MWKLLLMIGSMIIGLWKFFTGKAEEVKKKQDEKIKETKDAIKDGDTSTITSNLS